MTHPNHHAANQMTYEAFLVALPGYVLGALEADELLAVDAYLHAHPELVERLESLETTVAQMAYAAPQVPLPMRTRIKIVEQVRANAAGFSMPSNVAGNQAHEYGDGNGALALPASPLSASPLPASVVAAPPPAVAGRTSPLTQRISLERQQALTRADAARKPRSLFSSSVGWPLAGVAVVAALLLMLLLVRTQSTAENFRMQLSFVQQQVVALRAENADLRQSNFAFQDELQGQRDQLILLANPERSMRLVSQTDELLGGYFYAAQRTGLLVLRGVLPLPAAQTYQLWLDPDGGIPVSAGLISVTGSAVTTANILLPIRTDQFTSVGVTIEPATGSASPTGPIILLGQ